MNFIYYITVLLIVTVLIKELLYIKDIKIRTKKTLGEILIFAIGIITIIVITIVFAKNTLHYIVSCTGAALLIISWSKQGVSNKGLLIVARGKQLYEWNNIKKAKINISENIQVDYFSTLNSKIISHVYSTDVYEKILNEFNSHNLPYKTINKDK